MEVGTARGRAGLAAVPDSVDVAWTPASRSFDLVSCLYVHVAGSVSEKGARLASGVAPGGTLLLVGHLPVDRAAAGTGADAVVRAVYRP